MQLTQYYRTFELPWESDPEEQSRLRRYLLIGLALFVVLGLVLPLIHLQKSTETAAEAVPERLARLMVQPKPKPPTPPVEQPKPKPETPVKPVEVPKPVDRTEQAREKAQKYINRVQDALADLRQLDTTALSQTKNLQGAVGQDSHAERSLIASKAGTGSAGITSADSSRGFGTGAGSLTGHETGVVTSRIAAVGDNKVPTTSSGKAGRSREEIELIFDRNRGAIDAMYQRALRDMPDLQGKLVLEFTISPGGEVTECQVVSSELKDPELEHKIAERVKLFRFDAKDVAPVTYTKTIEFFPTSPGA